MSRAGGQPVWPALGAHRRQPRWHLVTPTLPSKLMCKLPTMTSWTEDAVDPSDDEVAKPNPEYVLSPFVFAIARKSAAEFCWQE
jgi:hypothetical protein